MSFGVAVEASASAEEFLKSDHLRFELEMIEAPGASDTRRQGADPGEGG
jgi:hypothetical protein